MAYAKTTLILTLIIILAYPRLTFASFFYLSPANSHIAPNNSLDLKLGLNTQGEQINAFTAALGYPTDKVKLDSIDYNLSVFPIGADEQKGDGEVKLSRGTILAVNGDLTIAILHFKTKNPGRATIDFTKDSAVPKATNSSDSLDIANSKGASVTISISSANIPTGTNSANYLPSQNTSNSFNQANNLTTTQPSSCQTKIDKLKLRFNSILDLTSAFKLRLDKIDSVLENYYDQQLLPQKKLLSNFSTLQQGLRSQNQIVSDQIRSLRKIANEINCDSNFQNNIISFKEQVGNLKKNLQQYQLINRKLLKAIQSTI